MVNVRTDYYYLLLLQAKSVALPTVEVPIQIHNNSLQAKKSIFACSVLSIEQAVEERIGVYVDISSLRVDVLLHIEGMLHVTLAPLYSPVGFIGKGVYFGDIHALCLFGIKQDVIYRYTHAKVKGSCLGLIDRPRSVGSVKSVYAGVLGNMNALLATEPVAYSDLFLDISPWFIDNVLLSNLFDFLSWRIWSISGAYLQLFDLPCMRYEIDDLDYAEREKFISEPCYLDADSYCGPFEYTVGGLAFGDLYSHELTMHIEMPRDVDGIELDASLNSLFFTGQESIYGPFYIVNAFADSLEDRVVDIAEDRFLILSYKPRSMTLVNLHEALYPLVVARLPSHSSPIYIDVALHLSSLTYVDIATSRFELCELFVIYIDTRQDVDAIVQYGGYLHIYRLQQRAFGAHRLLVFNKAPELDMEHVPFVKLEQARLSSVRYMNIITAPNNLGALYLVDDTAYQLFVKEDYRRVEPASFVASVGFMEDALVATDGEVTVVVAGAVTFIHTSGETFAFGAIMMRAPQLFTQEYRMYASILASPSGWSRETLDRAKAYMQTVDHDAIFAMGVYPYGVARVVAHENITRQYLAICGVCYAEFEGVRFFVDVESLAPTLSYFRYRKMQIVSISDSITLFSLLPDGLCRIANSGMQIVDLPPLHFYISSYRAVLYDPPVLTTPLTTTIHRAEYDFFDVGSYPTTFSFDDVYLEQFLLHVGALKADALYVAGVLEVEHRVKTEELLLSASLRLMVNLTTQELSMAGVMHISLPVTVAGAHLVGPYLHIVAGDKEVHKEYALGVIELNNEVRHARALMSSYPAIWMQIYGKVLDDVADISARMFDLQFSRSGFSVDIAFRYMYVDEVAGYEDDRPKPKKDELPSILLSRLHAQPRGFVRKKPQTRRCVSDIHSYIAYEIEDGGSVVVGNMDFDGKRDLYGGELVQKSSVFLPGRYASDLGALKNRLIDIVQASVNEDVVEAFDVKKFRLTEDDFGGMITADALRSINAQIEQTQSLGDIVRKVESITLSEYLAAHPESAEEIRMALNDLVSIADAYMWPGIPTRRPIDGKLFKRTRVDHSIYIFAKGEDV